MKMFQDQKIVKLQTKTLQSSSAKMAN